MNVYADLYSITPPGPWDVSFEWDDSILTDTDQQTQERLMLMNSGIMGRVEFRMWYFGETRAQAEAAIEAAAEAVEAVEEKAAEAVEAVEKAVDEAAPEA